MQRPSTASNSLTPEARKAFNAIDLHWHDLRHEYACRLAERGEPITKIQYLLGHASVVTTKRYIHRTRSILTIRSFYVAKFSDPLVSSGSHANAVRLYHQ